MLAAMGVKAKPERLRAERTLRSDHACAVIVASTGGVMTEDQTTNKQQIQTAVRATFSKTLVPTDIELGTAVEMPSSPLTEPDESSAEANDIIAQAPPLAKHDENPVEAKDEVAKWAYEVRDSTARTLELSKRLDDLLARPIRWFHGDAVDKSTAVKSEPDCDVR
jgi:hypothetical protein